MWGNGAQGEWLIIQIEFGFAISNVKRRDEMAAGG